MKKIILSALSFAILTGSVLAQGFYIRAGGTYGLPVGTAVVGDKYNYSYDGTIGNGITKTSNKVVTGSYGAGPQIALAAGYKFNQNFIFDLSASYLAGGKIESGSWYNYKYPTYSAIDQYVYKDNITGLFLNPSFVFSAGFGKAAPYGRFGVVLGSPKHSSTESYYSNSDGISYYDRTWVYKKGLALGYQAAIGMNWRLSDKFDIYTEVNILNMSWYAHEGEMTKYNSNGNDLLSSQTVSQSHITFVKSLDPNATLDTSKPTVRLRESSPLSAVSVNAGIRFTMFQKKDE
jgi:hypothetical protein